MLRKSVRFVRVSFTCYLLLLPLSARSLLRRQLDVAEDHSQDAFRAAADQAALEDAAREFRGVGGSSLFEFSDLAALDSVDGVAEAEVGEEDGGPLLVAVE